MLQANIFDCLSFYPYSIAPWDFIINIEHYQSYKKYKAFIVQVAIWINCVCDHFLARGGASFTPRTLHPEHLCDARVSTLLHWPLEKMHTEVSVSQWRQEASNLTQRLYDNLLTKVISSLNNVFKSWCYPLLVHNILNADFYGILAFHFIANRRGKMHLNNLLWKFTLY